MKIVSFMCVYNDPEFLDAALTNIKGFQDRLYIIEGSWRTSMRFGAAPRSDDRTYDVLERHVDGDRVVLIHANEATEPAQRQIGMNLAQEEGADWCFMLDADEVYEQGTLASIRRLLELALPDRDILGIRSNSFNFINSFWKYYDGNYPRIYRPTPGARFTQVNDMVWDDLGKDSWGSHIRSLPPELRFFHYSYMRRDPSAFHLKMNFVGEEDPGFLRGERQKYGFSNGSYTIPKDIEIKDFRGVHPAVIQAHPFYRSQLPSVFR